MKYYIRNAFLIFTISISLTASDNKKDILDSLYFPCPAFEIGKSLNNPLYAVNIYRTEINPLSINEQIKILETSIQNETDSNKFFEIGRLYHHINDYYSSSLYLNKFLSMTSSDSNDKNINISKGYSFLYLSEGSDKKKRIENLEISVYYFSKAVELDKNNIELLEILGDCYLYLFRINESLYCYNRIIEISPGNKKISLKFQASLFHRDYLNLQKNITKDNSIIPYSGDYSFDYLQTVINNSPKEIRDSYKLQQYIYLLRLILLHDNKSVIKNSGLLIRGSEKRIIDDADNFIKSMNKTGINNNDIRYISAIILYLKKDYSGALSNFNSLILENDPIYKSLEDEILFINIYCIKQHNELIKIINNTIKSKPEPEKYLTLARIEFLNGNLDKSEMLCKQALKIDSFYAEGYSALSVIYALKGNYTAADQMIVKGNSLIKKYGNGGEFLSFNMKVNEAAIALLKNEKERAYILLQSVLSVDDNEKGLLLYKRYFEKK